MSNIHILETSPDMKRINCIFHIAIPDSNNLVGTNWRTAIVRSIIPSAIMDYNDAAENADIETGAILEVEESIRMSSRSLTNQERLAEIEAAYIEKSESLLQELQTKLNFFGRVV